MKKWTKAEIKAWLKKHNLRLTDTVLWMSWPETTEKLRRKW